MLGEAWKLELEGITGAGVETGVEEAEGRTGGFNWEGMLGQAWGWGQRGTGASLGIWPSPRTGPGQLPPVLWLVRPGVLLTPQGPEYQPPESRF